ncbi:MAG: sulfite exporter TauE/SafE family protein [Chthoniobacterales bacterium]
MISPAEITGPMAALLAGLITSLHCIGMCGPLACSACARSGGKGSVSATFIYHGTRVFSYALVGVAAGLVGRRLSDALMGGSTAWMTWVFVIFFLTVVVGLDKRLHVPMPRSVLAWLGNASAQCGPRGRAGVLGFFTPLLPCAPLYLVVAAAALSGSALAGATVMAAFGLGTIPLILALQSQYFLLGARWSPQTMDYLRRGLALASVILLLVRGTYTGPDACPLCQ